MAIAAFAQALLAIPKTLAVNGAHDATDLVAKLRAYHHASQTKEDKKHYRNVGLDLHTGELCFEFFDLEYECEFECSHLTLSHDLRLVTLNN